MFVLTGNLQNAVNIGIRVGDSTTYEEFALKVPSTYFNNDMYITMSDIEGLPIRKNDASNDQIVFKGFIRNTESEKYILIDVGGGGASGGIDFQEAKKELVIGFTGAYNSSTDAMEFTIDNTNLIPYLDVEDENITLKLFIDNQTMTYTMLTKPIRFVNMNTEFLQNGYGRLYDIAYLTNMSQATPLTLLDLKKYAITDWEYILNVSVKENVGNKELFVTNERSDIEVLKGSDMPTYLTNAPHGQVVLCTERYESGVHDYQKGGLYQVDRTTYSSPVFNKIGGGVDVVSLSGSSGTLSATDLAKLADNSTIIEYSVSASLKVYMRKTRNDNTNYDYSVIPFRPDTLALNHYSIRVVISTGIWTYSSNQQFVSSNNIRSTGATAGQVLTADGSGGASFQNASGGSLYRHNIHINSSQYDFYITIFNNSSTQLNTIANIANWLNEKGYNYASNSYSGINGVIIVSSKCYLTLGVSRTAGPALCIYYGDVSGTSLVASTTTISSGSVSDDVLQIL